jgi:RNA polymerase sigma factor (TIGR02999 family)
MDDHDEVTALLPGAPEGHKASQDRLTELLYGELRRIAAYQLSKERRGHSLQPTALVHEAYIKVSKYCNQDWQSRAHFLASASVAMRWILVDHARKRPFEYVDLLDDAAADQPKPVDILDMERGLEKLSLLDPRQAQIVIFRVYGGMSNDEIAAVLKCSSRTVRREYRSACAWLTAEISPKPLRHVCAAGEP